jgi:hypothetical protein
MPRRYILGWYRVRMLLPSFQTLSKSLSDIKLIMLHNIRATRDGDYLSRYMVSTTPEHRIHYDHQEAVLEGRISWD